MSDYLYYCPDCNKLYKAGAVGKMIKCAQCSQLAYDMNITSEEYYKLSPSQRQELKDSFFQEQYEEDTDISGLFENPINESVPDMNAGQPKVQKPIVQQPVVQQPVMQQPAAQKPDVQQPAAVQEKTQQSVNSGSPVQKKRKAARSRVGVLLKLVSKIGIVLSILGGIIIFFMMGDMVDYETGFTYGFAIILLGSALNLAILGIGEICNLLTGIKQNQEL